MPPEPTKSKNLIHHTEQFAQVAHQTWANHSFAHFFAKNEQFAHKTDEWIPSSGFWRSLTKKDRVKSYRRYYVWYKIFSTLTQVFGRFFTDPDPDFSGSDRIRIFGRSRSGLTKKILIRIRKKNPDAKHCYNVCQSETLQWGGSYC